MSGPQGNVAEAQWVRDRLATWTATPIQWPNAPGATPEGSYIRPWVRRSGGEQASLGDGPMDRFDGMVVVEVFTPAMTGTQQSETLCDALEALFRRARTVGLTFFTPYTVAVGDTGDGWYKADVICPFVRDTVFTTSP